MTKSDWVSVGERLPEDNTVVLACGHDEHGEKIIGLATCTTSIILNGEKYWSDLSWPKFIGWGFTETITHWMPLPELPNG